MLSLAIGIPFGIIAGRSERFHRSDHAGARRDADRARVRLPDAGRDPVLGRPGRGRDLHDDLRDPAGRAHHRARHPRRHGDSVEAARAFGATPAQTLFKVQLPLARRQLLLSVNQTIMFALSLVVIAGLIGGEGLGDVVTNGLYSNAALAILAGIAIVIMAIALDRATSAIAERTDPTRRHLTDRGKRRGAHAHARHLRRDRRDRACLARALGARRHLPGRVRDRDHRLHGHDPRRTAALDPVRARLRAGPDLVHLRDHRADRELPARVPPRAAARVPRRDAVVHRARRAHRDRVRAERAAAGGHRAPDARGDRRDGRVGRGDGHRLAGAGGDRARRRCSAS